VSLEQKLVDKSKPMRMKPELWIGYQKLPEAVKRMFFIFANMIIK